jgi:hypothetical protein
MNTITRVISRISCFANCHPRIVLALALASIVAVVGLMAFGVFALFVPPAVPKLLLLAAITLAAFIAIKHIRG